MASTPHAARSEGWSGSDFVALAMEGGRATGGFGQLARELARVDSDVARVTPGAKDSRSGKDCRGSRGD